jgi:hypothetical protein
MVATRGEFNEAVCFGDEPWRIQFESLHLRPLRKIFPQKFAYPEQV